MTSKYFFLTYSSPFLSSLVVMQFKLQSVSHALKVILTQSNIEEAFKVRNGNDTILSISSLWTNKLNLKLLFKFNNLLSVSLMLCVGNTILNWHCITETMPLNILSADEVNQVLWRDSSEWKPFSHFWFRTKYVFNVSHIKHTNQNKENTALCENHG